MYSLFIISAVSIGFNKTISKRLVLALAVFGTLLAGYHFFIQQFADLNKFTPCIVGIDIRLLIGA